MRNDNEQESYATATLLWRHDNDRFSSRFYEGSYSSDFFQAHLYACLSTELQVKNLFNKNKNITFIQCDPKNKTNTYRFSSSRCDLRHQDTQTINFISENSLAYVFDKNKWFLVLDQNSDLYEEWEKISLRSLHRYSLLLKHVVPNDVQGTFDKYQKSIGSQKNLQELQNLFSFGIKSPQGVEEILLSWSKEKETVKELLFDYANYENDNEEEFLALDELSKNIAVKSQINTAIKQSSPNSFSKPQSKKM